MLERESTHEQGQRREGEREAQAGSTLSVQSLMRGSNSWTTRSRPEPKSRVRRLTDGTTQAPQWPILLFIYFFIVLFLFFLTLIYYWETERGRAWAREGQREEETQNPKQAPGSELSAQSLRQGSNSQTARSWPEPKWDAQPTEPPGKGGMIEENSLMIRSNP